MSHIAILRHCRAHSCRHYLDILSMYVLLVQNLRFWADIPLLILTLCFVADISPNGRLTHHRYLYQSGERIEAGDAVFLDNDDSTLFRVVKGNKGNVNDPSILLQCETKEVPLYRAVCSRLTRVSLPRHPWSRMTAIADCKYLILMFDSKTKPSHCIRHKLALGFGFIEQHSDSFHVCRIGIALSRLPIKYLESTHTNSKLILSYDSSVDILSIQIAKQEQDIQQWYFASLSACGNDLVLCCDDDNLVCAIQLQDATHWIKHPIDYAQ